MSDDTPANDPRLDFDTAERIAHLAHQAWGEGAHVWYGRDGSLMTSEGACYFPTVEGMTKPAEDERANLPERRLAAVLALHTYAAGLDMCAHCEWEWPCPTVLIVRSDQ